MTGKTSQARSSDGRSSPVATMPSEQQPLSAGASSSRSISKHSPIHLTKNPSWVCRFLESSTNRSKIRRPISKLDGKSCFNFSSWIWALAARSGYRSSSIGIGVSIITAPQQTPSVAA
ncbi:hypothetical protein ACLOJK_034308 [Asimina triloba]